MSYKRTFILDYSADASKRDLELLCVLKNVEGEVIKEFHEHIVEIDRGVYQITISGIQDDHRGSLSVYQATNSSTSSSDDPITFLAAFAINPEECEYVKALYHSEIDYLVDDAAGIDKWTVAFFKNGILLPFTSLDTPTLFVYEEGGSLKFYGSLTVLGGGLAARFCKYYATGAERGLPGENLNGLAYAVIDGVYTLFPRIHGRDS